MNNTLFQRRKQSYLSPGVTVVEIVTERGLLASLPITGDDRSIESRTMGEAAWGNDPSSQNEERGTFLWRQRVGE